MVVFFFTCDGYIMRLWNYENSKLDVDGHDKRWGRAGIYTALSRATSQAFILRKPDTANR